MLLNGLFVVVIPKKFHHACTFLWKSISIIFQSYGLKFNIIITFHVELFQTKYHCNGSNSEVSEIIIGVRLPQVKIKKFKSVHQEKDKDCKCAGVETTFRHGDNLISINPFGLYAFTHENVQNNNNKNKRTFFIKIFFNK